MALVPRSNMSRPRPVAPIPANLAPAARAQELAHWRENWWKRTSGEGLYIEDGLQTWLELSSFPSVAFPRSFLVEVEWRDDNPAQNGGFLVDMQDRQVPSLEPLSGGDLRLLYKDAGLGQGVLNGRVSWQPSQRNNFRVEMVPDDTTPSNSRANYYSLPDGTPVDLRTVVPGYANPHTSNTTMFIGKRGNNSRGMIKTTFYRLAFLQSPGNPLYEWIFPDLIDKVMGLELVPMTAP